MIVIAESKTMAENLPPHLSGDLPCFQEQADEIMHVVASMTPAEVVSMLHCSTTMAGKVILMAKAFGLVHPHLQAIEAFTGVVFRSLDFDTLSKKAQTQCCKDVRIISSVYGLLHPNDTILPYRMDYGVTIPGMTMSLKKYWRTKLTGKIGRHMKENNDSLILILPADARECLDLKTLRGLGSVATVELRTYSDSGKLTTPRAERLKNRRGLLLRQLLEKGVRTPTELERFTSPDFEYIGQNPYPGRYAFLC